MSLITNDAIMQHFGYPGAVNDKVRAFFNAMYAGNGSPEGVTTAPTGSFYYDTTNGSFYAKQSGSGNTGWVAGVGLNNGPYVPVELSALAVGVHQNTDSPTYGKWFTIGNKPNSAGFAGTGTPAEAYAPIVFYNEYGLNPGKTDVIAGSVTKTTQGFFGLVNYFRPTGDDAAEGFSYFVGIKDNTGYPGGAPFAQTKTITAIEGIAQLEGANTALTGDGAPMIAMGGRTMVVATSHAATVAGFKAAHNPSGGPFGTTDKYIGFWQPTASGAATAYGAYVVDRIVSETGLSLGFSGATAQFVATLLGGPDTNVSQLLITGTTASPGVAQATFHAGSTQTKPIVNVADSGGTNRFQWASTGFQTVTGSGTNYNTSGGVTKLRLDSTQLAITDVDVVLSAVTGTRLGSVGGASGQKLAFLGATPVVQQVLATGAAHTVDDLITFLQTIGLCRQS